MEKEKRIPDSDCSSLEQMCHDFWVRIRYKPNKKYLVTCHRINFLTCDCPWSIQGKNFQECHKGRLVVFPFNDFKPITKSLNQN